MRAIYSLFAYLVLPFAFLRLAWRGYRAPDYFRRWPERLGFYRASARDVIWIHAVSVGETEAAVPLVKALRERYPDAPILISNTTPTGSAHCRKRFGGDVLNVYLPYDTPDAVARFLKAFRPRIGIVMETEWWPNLFAACSKRGVPLVLANGRLSAKSARGYRKLGALVRDTLRRIDLIAAQTQADADRYLALGADPARVTVTGSIKFDLHVPASVREVGLVVRGQLGANRPVWMIASSHAEEEPALLDAVARVNAELPASALIWVPRHPERFESVAQACEARGWRIARRSGQQPADKTTQIYVGDSMGEMLAYYAASDVAFVGGSLIPVGGHNLLEPAALGVPALTGTHTHNFSRIVEWLVEAGHTEVVDTAEQLALRMIALLGQADERARRGQAGEAVVASQRGALDRLLEQVARLMR